MPRTLGPILEISYDYLIHIVVWNHSLMCLVLIRYKTTKVFVINNLDFGSISTGVGLSILISNLSKKRGFFADFLFYQLSLVCFYHLHIWLVHIYFYYFEKFFRDIYLFYAHCFLSILLHNFDFWHTIIHSLVFISSWILKFLDQMQKKEYLFTILWHFIFSFLEKIL